MQYKNNKKGVKLLAAVMAFAMVFVAGFAIIGLSSESDAVTPVDSDIPNVKNYDADQTLTAGAYLVSGTVGSNVEVAIGDTASVTLLVKSGTTVVVTASVEYILIPVTSDVTVTDAGSTVEKGKIAGIYEKVSSGNTYTVSAKASTTQNANAEGSITTTTESSTIEGEAVSVYDDTTDKYTYYTVKAIPSTSFSPDTSSSTKAVKFTTNAVGVTMSLKNGINSVKFENITVSNEFTVTMTGSDSKIELGMTSSAAALSAGKIHVISGVVDFASGNAPTFTGSQIIGVASADLSSASAGKQIASYITLTDAGELDCDAYIYGISIKEASIIQPNGKTYVFGEGSSFDGRITALTGAAGSVATGTVVGLEISGTTATRTVTLTNAAGVQTVACANTGLIAETTNLYGSEVCLTYVGGTGNVVFSANAIANAIGLGDLTVDRTIDLKTTSFAVIPSGRTVTFDSTSASKIITNNIVVLGDVNGSQNITTVGSEVYRIIGSSDNATATVAKAVGSKITSLNSYLKTSATAAEVTATTITGAATLANQGYAVTIDNTTTINGDATFIAADVTVNNTVNITAGVTIKLLDETQFKAGTSALLVLKNGSELVIKDSNILLEVSKEDLAEVKVDAKTSVYTNPTGPIAVGYMREATLDGDINGATADVYGKLTISSETKLSSGSVMNVYKGGSLVVDGELTVEGKVNFKAGSAGEVNGTMTIGSSNGGAEVNVNASNITVSENGTVKVSSINNKATKDNKLTITGSVMPIYSDGVISNPSVNPVAVFSVEGTLDMKGMLEADKILDKGTITINGKSTDSTIYVFDAVTLTVTSVKGTLSVMDAGIVDDLERARVKIADGNEINLTDVAGVTITEEVTTDTYTIETINYRVYTTNMYISGTFGAIDKNTNGYVNIASSAPADENGKKAGKVEVQDSIVLGKDVTLSSSAEKFVISGTVDSIVENSSIAINGGKTTVTGTVTVKAGTDFAYELTGEDYLNAAKYVITDNTNGIETYTFTNLENAIRASATVDDKTIYVLGQVTTTEESIEVPSKIIIEIDGELVIGKKTSMTAVAGSEVNGDLVTVKGSFTAKDYVNTLDLDNVVGDVIYTEGADKIWTGIVVALQNATEGTTITLNNNVEIDEDVTVGKGVTVYSEHNIVIKKNTVLTVAGNIEIVKGRLTAQNGTLPDVTGKLVVTGTGSVALVAASASAPEEAVLVDVAGAHYTKLIGAKYFQFVSNIETAASSIDEKVYGDTIRIVGEVTSDAVKFVKAEKATDLTINIDAPTDTVNKKTVVIMDIEIVGAKLVIDKGAVYSGKVTAAADGGNAIVSFDGVKGFNVETHIDNSASTPVDSLLISSSYDSNDSVAEGKVTIVSGKVTVGQVASGGTIGAGKITTDKKIQLTVGSEATLAVPSLAEIIIDANGKKASMTVDGTLDVTKGKVTVTGILDVNGKAIVAESGNDKGIVVTDDKGIMNIIGTLNISVEDGREGRVYNNNIVTVGSKPSDLGVAGTVTGIIGLAEPKDYVKVYNGTVDKIKTDSGSDALYTKVVINDVDYMTVYGSSSVDVREVIKADDIKLTGIDGFTDDTMIFSDREMLEIVSEDSGDEIKLGDYEAVYFKLSTSTATVVISVGTHMTLWIDGEKYVTNTGSESLYKFTVGVHQVKIVVDAGYTGETKIMFNGKEITNGQFEITLSMMNERNTLTATGDLTLIPAEEPKDSGMGITDYLLIVLVILAAILVVVVAIRMMRS